MQKFDRNKVKPGDPLVYREQPTMPLWFKFMGHGGEVVCTYQGQDRLQDVILKQKQLALAASPSPS